MRHSAPASPSPAPRCASLPSPPARSSICSWQHNPVCRGSLFSASLRCIPHLHVHLKSPTHAHTLATPRIATLLDARPPPAPVPANLSVPQLLVRPPLQLGNLAAGLDDQGRGGGGSRRQACEAGGRQRPTSPWVPACHPAPFAGPLLHPGLMAILWLAHCRRSGNELQLCCASAATSSRAGCSSSKARGGSSQSSRAGGNAGRFYSGRASTLQAAGSRTTLLPAQPGSRCSAPCAAPSALLPLAEPSRAPEAAPSGPSCAGSMSKQTPAES